MSNYVLSDILNELQSNALASLIQRHPELSEEELRKSADEIGKAALIYANFTQSMERDMIYDPDAMLDLTNQSGPYIQYTAVRIRSLVESVGMNVDDDIDNEKVKEVTDKLSPEWEDITVLLASFPEVVANCATGFKPHMLAKFLYKLSSTYNKWYSGTNERGKRMIDLPERGQQAYAELCKAVYAVLNRGLNLLNISIPDRM